VEKFNNFLEQHKFPIALSLVGIVLIVGGIFSSGLNSAKPTYAETTSKTSTSGVYKVDVSGAVEKPAVYSLSASSRVEDAVTAAGGFSPDVNKAYISKTLNLSQKITDGQKIYIPFEGDDDQTSLSGQSISSKTNINSASEAELDSLPGVGPATAQKIISGRPYSDIADLTSKKIVTKSIYNKIQSLIEIN
jgi:competence protein ComEA